MQSNQNLSSVSVPETTAPLTLRSAEQIESIPRREITLADALSLALENGDVLTDLGAGVLRTPDQMQTEWTEALQRLDPQESVEAALSAYDAQLYGFGKWQNNDRRFNNRFFGGGSNAFKQDTHDYVMQLSKRTATGAQFSVRSVTDYDANNATGNLTNSAWQTQLHAEARQPLLQGGGLQFNRIAGPAALPGVYNGVLIAKVNSEVTTTQFEQGLRDYVSNVINAYWDLYFAYRDADAKREAMLRSQKTWQNYEAQRSSNRASGPSEALAREQYFRFRSEYQDAVAGKPSMRTQNNNATTGGAFAGVGGVQAAERRLRLILGIPINDGTLLRPIDEPSIAKIEFDWDSIAAEAVVMRSELRQQRLEIKRCEMELLAAKNFLLPTLDLVTIYRLRGLDKDLAGSDSALSDLGSFDLQEYEASLEFKLPVGFRQGHLAVRNAKLQVSRERAILDAQQRQIMHDLTSMVAECDRAYEQLGTNFNRYLAASDALNALDASQGTGMKVNFDQLLDAQRRVTESQSHYYSALVEYTIATKNVHLEKGTLLRSSDVLLITE
ncbi:TolC family protein [Stieleria sp. TO1_6]|uniref:TolC family protein n=1 Tax=Stieleria tagensis TaxID=2956795 RepID=UPI00209A6CC3|nr:TolC family protein [Stieleria tagensis]MCO8121380.1 TolC family protein [Stieleria tagensis]